MPRSDNELCLAANLLADSWERMNRARSGPTEANESGCGHGSLLNDAALVHCRALTYFLDGPYRDNNDPDTSDLRPSDFGVEDWKPGSADKTLATRFLVHLTWQRALPEPGFVIPMGHLFDYVNVRMTEFTDHVADRPWAGKLCSTRDSLQ